MPSLSPCASLVRERDHDRFLCGLFAPADVREDLYAVEAFELEIARIRSTASEPLLGQIRMQWWRQALDDAFAGTRPARHPVVEAVSTAIRRRPLARNAFEGLLDTRARDLEPTLPESLEVALERAGSLGTSLADLRLGALGIHHAPTGEAVHAVSTASVLTDRARAAATRNVDPISHDGERGQFAVADLSHQARALLRAARARQGEVRREGIALLLPAVLASRDLQRLEAARYGSGPAGRRIPSPLSMVSLWWYARRNRY